MGLLRHVGPPDTWVGGRFFRSGLLVSSAHRGLFRSLKLRCNSDLMRLLGRTTPLRQRKVCVRPVLLPVAGGSPLAAHYKEYTFLHPSWRYWLRPSKALCEFRSYGVFERLGIPCAERIACGEERDWLGRLRHAFVITRTLASPLTLAEFFQQVCPRRDTAGSRSLRDLVCLELAGMLRRLHRAHFFHNDLHWRNILIQWTPGQLPLVWWIDCPRGGFDRWSPRRWRRRNKDLATLEASARFLCTRTERLRFFKHYLGVRKLSPRHKRLARAIIRAGLERSDGG